MLVVLLPLVAADPASAFEWTTDSAADQGMCVSATIPGLCKQKLDALKVSQTGDIIVIRNDKIIFEWYASGAGPAGSGHGRNTSLMGTWSSVTKSLIGATSMAYAYDHCGLRDTDLASKYIPGWLDQGTYTATSPGNWPTDPDWGNKHRYTRLAMLASHMSGLADNHSAADLADIEQCQAGNQPLATHWQPYEARFWDMAAAPNDPWTIARRRAPYSRLVTDKTMVGKVYQYSNSGVAMLGYAVTKACSDSTAAANDDTIRDIMQNKIFNRIDFNGSGSSWALDRAVAVDGMTLYNNWGQLKITPGGAAKLGRLYLNNGIWDNAVVLQPSTVALATRPTTWSRNYSNDRLQGLRFGWTFWHNDKQWATYSAKFPSRRTAAISSSAYWAFGASDRFVLVDPLRNLIVVRHGVRLPCSQGSLCAGSNDNPDCSTQGRTQDFLKIIGDSFYYTAPSVRWGASPANASSTGGPVTIAAACRAYNGSDTKGMSYGAANTIEGMLIERVDSAGNRSPVTSCAGTTASSRTCSATVQPTVPTSYVATCTTHADIATSRKVKTESAVLLLRP